MVLRHVDQRKQRVELNLWLPRHVDQTEKGAKVSLVLTGALVGGGVGG